MKRPAFIAVSILPYTATKTEGTAVTNAMCMTGFGGRRKAESLMKVPPGKRR